MKFLFGMSKQEWSLTILNTRTIGILINLYSLETTKLLLSYGVMAPFICMMSQVVPMYTGIHLLHQLVFYWILIGFIKNLSGFPPSLKTMENLFSVSRSSNRIHSPHFPQSCHFLYHLILGNVPSPQFPSIYHLLP